MFDITDLFDDFNSRFFAFIIEAMYKKELTKKDIDDLKRKYNLELIFEYSGYQEMLFPTLIKYNQQKLDEEKCYFLPKKKGDEIVWICEAELSTPIRMSTHENQAFLNLVHNRYLQCFLGQSTIDKVKNVSEEIANDIGIRWSEEDIVRKNVLPNDGPIEELIFKECVRSVSDSRNVSLQTKDGKQYEGVAAKITYIPYNDAFSLVIYLKESKTFETINISKISLVNTGSIEMDISDISILYKEYLAKREKKAILFIRKVDAGVIRDNYAERDFRQLSYYKKEAREVDNGYKIAVYYQPEEEQQLIRDILSMGHAATVAEPNDLRECVREKIKSSLEQLGGFTA